MPAPSPEALLAGVFLLNCPSFPLGNEPLHWLCFTDQISTLLSRRSSMTRPSRGIVKSIRLFSYIMLLLLVLLIQISPIDTVYAASLTTHQSLARSYRFGEQQCSQPSHHVDLTKLSDTQLAEYGFPTHESIDTDLKQWQMNFSKASYRSCSSSFPRHLQSILAPTFGLANAAGPTPAPLTISTNWAGYEAQNLPTSATSPATATFNKGQISFSIPLLNPSTHGDVSEWVGIGGDPTLLSDPSLSVLVQAGADSTIDSSGKQVNTLWWEEYPDFPSETLSFSHGVHTGDQIFIYVESNVNNNNTDKFYIQNLTTHEYHSVTISLTNSRQYTTDGVSGECIVERPTDTITGKLSGLPNFGLEKIIGCKLGKTQGLVTPSPIGSFQHLVKIDMLGKTQWVKGSEKFDLPYALAITGSLDASGQGFDVLSMDPPVPSTPTPGGIQITLTI